MPYKSKAQESYFNANRGKLEAQGVNVGEWNSASKGKKLPAYKSEKHEYDHKRPKRQVMSRYSK